LVSPLQNMKVSVNVFSKRWRRGSWLEMRCLSWLRKN